MPTAQESRLVIPRLPDGEPDPEAYYTAAMVDALNDPHGRKYPRYETVHGELLVVREPPGPVHQFVQFELAYRIRRYVETHPVGVILPTPVKVTFGARDVNVDPDVIVMSPEAARALRATRRWEIVRSLLLVVEVLSPSTSRHDRFTKRRLFQEYGVPLYWIVDERKRQVEVFTPADDLPRIERERLVWHPDGADEPFTVTLAELFDAP